MRTPQQHSSNTPETDIPQEWNERLTLMVDFQSSDHWIMKDRDPVKAKTKDITHALLTKFFDDETAATKFASFIGNNEKATITRPGIYPLHRGGIQFEWEENNIDFSIEIPNNGDIEISAFGENVDWDAMIGPYGDPEDIADKAFKQLSLIRDNIH